MARHKVSLVRHAAGQRIELHLSERTPPFQAERPRARKTGSTAHPAAGPRRQMRSAPALDSSSSPAASARAQQYCAVLPDVAFDSPPIADKKPGFSNTIVCRMFVYHARLTALRAPCAGVPRRLAQDMLIGHRPGNCRRRH